ncbi:hypothetical protein ACOMHN_037574 [Nucella lapillus]
MCKPKEEGAIPLPRENSMVIRRDQPASMCDQCLTVWSSSCLDHRMDDALGCCFPPSCGSGCKLSASLLQSLSSTAGQGLTPRGFAGLSVAGLNLVSGWSELAGENGAHNTGQSVAGVNLLGRMGPHNTGQSVAGVNLLGRMGPTTLVSQWLE